MRVEDIISNVQIYGFEDSVKGSKYPMAVDLSTVDGEVTPRTVKLAQAERGSGHDNFLNGVIVQFDLTFTNKAWVEAERYHFLDFVSSQSTMEEKIIQIPIDRIQASRYQPRIKFDEKALEELAQSIRQNGVIQPITVREVEDHYEIIAGERRFRACRMRGSIAQASELGFTVASSLLFPLLAGLWIGGQAGNRKLGAIIGALIGLLTAFGALWQMVWKRK